MNNPCIRRKHPKPQCEKLAITTFRRTSANEAKDSSLWSQTGKLLKRGQPGF